MWLGAKLANGIKVCIAFDSDSSLNMMFTELKMIAEYNIPTKIMILENKWKNDGCILATCHIAAHNQQNLEYKKITGAFGINSFYCDCAGYLDTKMNEFLFNDHYKLSYSMYVWKELSFCHKLFLVRP